MEKVHWFEQQTAVNPFLMQEQGFTYLMLACNDENHPAVLRLLQEGADVNATSKFGETGLLLAVRYAYKDTQAALNIVRLLLENGADINAQVAHNGETALMRSVYYGYNEIFRLLLKHNADINLRRSDGDTVLSIVESSPSVARGRKRMIRMLEEAGGIR